MCFSAKGTINDIIIRELLPLFESNTTIETMEVAERIFNKLNDQELKDSALLGHLNKMVIDMINNMGGIRHQANKSRIVIDKAFKCPHCNFTIKSFQKMDTKLLNYDNGDISNICIIECFSCKEMFGIKGLFKNVDPFPNQKPN